jgi:hypothetical protein
MDIIGVLLIYNSEHLTERAEAERLGTEGGDRQNNELRGGDRRGGSGEDHHGPQGHGQDPQADDCRALVESYHGHQ